MGLDFGVVALSPKGMRSVFERDGPAYSGTLRVRVPIAAPHDMKDKFVEIAVTITDSFPEHRRAAHVFPDDLPLEDPWPFAWRVEALPESAACDPDKVTYRAARSFTNAAAGISFVSVRVLVFALQGVAVSAIARVPNRPDATIPPQGAGGQFWKVQVIVDKLPRPESLPHSGNPVRGPHLHPAFPVELADKPADLAAVTAFHVRHIPNGVVIRHLATGAALTLRNLLPRDPDVGFAYSFDHEAGKRRRDGRLIFDHFLHLRITRGIGVRFDRPLTSDDPEKGKFIDPLEWMDRLAAHAQTLDRERRARALSVPMGGGAPPQVAYIAERLESLAEGYLSDLREVFGEDFMTRAIPEPPRHGLALRDMADARFFRLEIARTAADLPPFGAPFRVDRDIAGREFKYYLAKDLMTKEESARQQREQALLVVEMALGMVPIIGDAIDLADLALAATTGCDRNGKPVGGLQLAVMGLVCIPALGEVLRPLKLSGKLA